MWMPVSDVSEETGRRGVEGGGRCEVAVDPAQKFPTANRDPGSTFSPARSKRRRLRQKRAGSVRLVGPCGEAPPPSEDQLFRHKCLELQRYVHPLESILQRLKSGQFSRRLSSLQQDVAVERIQRIMAMLQNPNMGGSFLTNIQKLEGMLKSWFPHVSPTLNQIDNDVLAKRRKSYTSSSAQEVTQVNTVSSSTDCPRKRGRPMDTPLRPALQGLPFSITSPCLERLLQAKDSIVAPPLREAWSCHDVGAVTEDR